MVDPYWFKEVAGGFRLGLSPEFVETVKGDWVGLELAAVGTRVRSGESFGFITTDRAAHDLRATRDFFVRVVNSRCLANPALAQLSPLSEGWLMEVEFFAQKVKERSQLD